MGSAKVNLKEIDLSTTVPSFKGIAGGIVLPAKKGKVGVPVLITSEQNLIDTFGEPDPKLGLAHYSAIAFLAQSNKLWVVRPDNNAKFSGTIVCAKDHTSFNKDTDPQGIADPNKYTFQDNDKESLLVTASTPGKYGDKLSFTIQPSNFYKDAYIIKVYQDTKEGKELVETIEFSRISQKDGNGNQLQLEQKVNERSQFIKIVDNKANIDSAGNPEALFVDSLYDYNLFKQAYTLKTGEELKKASDKGTDKGHIVFNDGIYWEYLGETKEAGHTINPADFTAEKSKAEWKALDLTPKAVYLKGGSDGEAITTGHLMKAADKMANPDLINVTCFMDGGFTDHAYHAHLVKIAEQRINSFVFLSTDPKAETTPSTYVNEVVNYRRTAALNTSYAALYSPHVKIYDKFNDIYIYASPDGFAAGAMAYTARNFEMWTPPAGWDAGKLLVQGLSVTYTEGERDVLYDNGINPLRQDPTKGIAIWGQKTLQAKPSALDRVNVRMLLITIEPPIMEYLDFFEFKLNDKITRLLVQTGIEAKLQDIKARGGLYDFKVVCDETNNTPVRIDNNELYVDIYVKPVKSVEFITFRTVITTTGANFNAVQLG